MTRACAGCGRAAYMRAFIIRMHTHVEWTPRYNADGKFECKIQGIIATDIIQCVIRDANTAMRFVTTDGLRFSKKTKARLLLLQSKLYISAISAWEQFSVYVQTKC